MNHNPLYWLVVCTALRRGSTYPPSKGGIDTLTSHSYHGRPSTNGCPFLCLPFLLSMDLPILLLLFERFCTLLASGSVSTRYPVLILSYRTHIVPSPPNIPLPLFILSCGMSINDHEPPFALVISHKLGYT